MGQEEEVVHETCPMSHVSHDNTKAPTGCSILNMIINIEQDCQPRGFAPGPPRLRRDRLILQPPTPEKYVMSNSISISISISISMSKFTCRTLPPWDEVTQKFTFPSNFKHWFTYIAGADDTQDYTSVNEWLSNAQPGDVIYLNDDLRPVERTDAEIEIRCN
jgi:hypothetical protein